MIADCALKITTSTDGQLLFQFPDKQQVNEYYILLNETWPQELGEFAEGGTQSSLVITGSCCLKLST